MHTAACSISGLDFQVALPAPLRRGFLLCRGYAFFLLLGGDAHHVMSIRLSGPETSSGIAGCGRIASLSDLPDLFDRGR
jgi:hypothetical protein